MARSRRSAATFCWPSNGPAASLTPATDRVASDYRRRVRSRWAGEDVERPAGGRAAGSERHRLILMSCMQIGADPRLQLGGIGRLGGTAANRHRAGTDPETRSLIDELGQAAQPDPAETGRGLARDQAAIDRFGD